MNEPEALFVYQHCRKSEILCIYSCLRCIGVLYFQPQRNSALASKSCNDQFESVCECRPYLWKCMTLKSCVGLDAARHALQHIRTVCRELLLLISLLCVDEYTVWHWVPFSYQFNVKFLDRTPNPVGILGSKAQGEPPLCLAPSIFYAVKVRTLSCRSIKWGLFNSRLRLLKPGLGNCLIRG